MKSFYLDTIKEGIRETAKAVEKIPIRKQEAQFLDRVSMKHYIPLDIDTVLDCTCVDVNPLICIDPELISPELFAPLNAEAKAYADRQEAKYGIRFELKDTYEPDISRANIWSALTGDTSGKYIWACSKGKYVLVPDTGCKIGDELPSTMWTTFYRALIADILYR